MSLTPFVRVATLPVLGGPPVPVDAPTTHHLRRVLRLSEGAPVLLTDGAGAAVAARLVPAGVEATAAATGAARPRPRIALAQAVPKGRRFDDVVRVAVELGVDRVLPLLTDRTVVRFDGPEAARSVARWQAVADAAAHQARRAWWPTVDAVRRPEDLAGPAVVVADLGAPGPLALADGPSGPALRSADEVVVAVGPEGGWTDRERDLLRAGGATTLGLGASVLRAEHAGAAVVAVLAALLGRWEADPAGPSAAAPPLPS